MVEITPIDLSTPEGNSLFEQLRTKCRQTRFPHTNKVREIGLPHGKGGEALAAASFSSSGFASFPIVSSVCPVQTPCFGTIYLFMLFSYYNFDSSFVLADFAEAQFSKTFLRLRR